MLGKKQNYRVIKVHKILSYDSNNKTINVTGFGDLDQRAWEHQLGVPGNGLTKLNNCMTFIGGRRKNKYRRNKRKNRKTRRH